VYHFWTWLARCARKRTMLHLARAKFWNDCEKWCLARCLTKLVGDQE
jgi:hypothetical protein